MWKVTVETTDGEERVFQSLDTYSLTPEQKLLWKKLVGDRIEEEKVTNLRIKTIIETKIKDE